MELKGLVLQSMPQETMIRHIAHALRKRHGSVSLASARSYLKEEGCFATGSLKIGRLVVDEAARQNAVNARRDELRAVVRTTIQLNVDAVKRRGDKPYTGIDERYLDYRTRQLAMDMCAEIVLMGTGSDRPRKLLICPETMSPTYRVCRFRSECYGSACLCVHIGMTTGATRCVTSLTTSFSSREDTPHDRVERAAGKLVARGKSVSFDKHLRMFSLDGVLLNPIELVAQVELGGLTTIELPALKSVLQPTG